MKKTSTLIAALCVSTALNAQTYMKVETAQGTYKFDISQVKQVYFETETVDKDIIEPF